MLYLLQEFADLQELYDILLVVIEKGGPFGRCCVFTAFFLGIDGLSR
jgi:hypothetical protein